jgi:hypothetical protein
MAGRVHGLVQHANDLDQAEGVEPVNQDVARCVHETVIQPRPLPRMAKVVLAQVGIEVGPQPP